MKRYFHNDDFEYFLQQEADNFCMYPSDRSWENVSRKTRVPSRWPALPIISLIVISALVLGTVLIKPAPDTVISKGSNLLPQPITERLVESLKGNSQNEKNNFTPLSVAQLTHSTILQAQEKINAEQMILSTLIMPEQVAITNSNTLINQDLTINSSINESVLRETTLPKYKTATPNLFTKSSNNSEAYHLSVQTFNKKVNTLKYGLSKKEKSVFDRAGITNDDYQLEEDMFVKMHLPEKSNQNNKPLDRLQKTSSRFDFRFYVTPSISYRRLLNEKGEEITGTQNSLVPYETSLISDASRAIRHAPATGYETGIGIGYKINKKLTLTTGAQFNISQYKVNASLYSEEETAGLDFGEGAFTSTVTTSTSLRSTEGSVPVTFKNRYYELSLPIGLDFTALSNGKYSWGIAGSIQPTYIFDKQPLVISNNFKNYADASSYIRNLNINASFETYFGITSGNFRYQLGPQIRYQFLPTLTNKFQTREYLLNYGFKLGIVKYLR